MKKKDGGESNRSAIRTDAAARARGEVIAHRRSCEAEGTGLTHFILVEEKRKLVEEKGK